MKHSLYILFFIFLGCNHKGKILVTDFPPPPPPPFLLPPAPPSFTPTRESVLNIQVNSIPHPFNIGGAMPYAIWVNGKLLPMSPKLSTDVAKALNLKFTQPKDTARIHNGEGWLSPLEIIKENP